MNDESQAGRAANPRRRGPDLWRAPRSRSGGVFAAGVILALLLAACGSAAPSNGVATLDSPGASGSPAASGSGAAISPDPYQAMLAYAQCMRTHGIAKFPDPVNDGNGRVGLALRGGPGTGLDPNSAQFQAAQEACQSLMPAPKGGSAQDNQEMKDQALAYSACMRSHGIANFPDPEFSGGGMKMSMPSGMDPNSAQFKAAQQACQANLPGFAGGGIGSGGAAGPSDGSKGTATQP